MRKTFLLLFAVMLTATMSARKICIWRDGSKAYELSIQVNDSITFDHSANPQMHIWRNNAQLYNFSLQANDSITYVSEFDYDGWREQKTIDIYAKDHTWQKVNLPWDDVAVTTMPEQYRYPNKEFFTNPNDSTDSIPVWELAFNLCPESTLEGVHMFGLWDKRSSTMRIYSYLEEVPSANATYCFYEVTTSSPAFMERDAMVWMPSDSIIRKGNWNASALSGTAAPSTVQCDLMPYAGTLDGQINRGWLCADMHFGSGQFNVPENGTINFTLYAVENLDLTGTVALAASLKGTDNGTLTIPGNKTKKAAGLWTASGSLFSGIATAVSQGIASGTQTTIPEIGIGVGICQGLGAIWSMVGNCKNAYEEAEDKHYTLNMDLNISGTIKGQFDGQLSGRFATTVSPVTIAYDKFFEGVLNHQTTNSLEAPSHGDKAGKQLSFGIWNLKRQPVYYVYNNYVVDGETGSKMVISFLDPTSIELDFSMDNELFDANEIDSIKLVAYDVVFVDNNYNLQARPYYDFYGIQHDHFSSGPFANISLCDEDFLLDTKATIKSFTKGNFIYTGVSSDSIVAMGLSEYNMVYSPGIHINSTDNFINLAIEEINVVVLVEVFFSNGESRIFAERFLPEIKLFGAAEYEARGINDRISDASAPTSINGIPFEHTMFTPLKEKARRLLFEAVVH